MCATYVEMLQIMTFGSAIKISMPIQPVVVGGLILLIISVLLDVNPAALWSEAEPITPECQGPTNPSGVISRQQLSQLLTVPIAAPKQDLETFLDAPYCQLAMPGAESLLTLGYAYPLAFDPQTWLVVLYEGDRYVRYDFLFQDR
jgi:hypothetical protein